MIKIVHRVNTIRQLKKIPPRFGVEVDIRGFGKKLVLNHEPLKTGDNLERYLKNYRHRFIILNIKETGIENRVLELCKKYKISDYFLLDVEAPYIYRAAKRGESKIAMRYSENEPLEGALVYKGKVDWLWIDVCTKLPLNKNIVKKISPFKTCLVSPECWGRPKDIKKYQRQMRKLNFHLDAVMADWEYINLWY
jgi:hypothetical protein